MSNQRIRIFVTGKVQGVFFRQALKVMAKKNDVFGWVKNLKDGRVEAVLEGNEEKVSRLVEWSHGGPANARVEDIEICNEKFTGEFSKFDVLY
ncbi:MAG TPA: acylphosphatase [Nitrosopumilus sp.]|nr:acylphosphatase [Thermoproteota archaeon]HJJ22607.1 acylphosphatase [Nitrosopumilus sp.]